MDRRLYTTLIMHNPWLEEPGSQARHLAKALPPTYLERAPALELQPGKAHLVVGPRQCGKSTWIRHVLAKQRDPVLILHAEEPAVRELAISPAAVLAALGEILTEETIVLVEEIQHLRDAPLLLKGLVDLRRSLRIVATGSSSFQFQSKTRESLAGRAHRTLLLPLSLAETGRSLPAALLPAVRAFRLARQWERLLTHGGYPEPWLAQRPELRLHELLESFVLRDATDLHVVENPSAFRTLLELAAADVGNLANLSNWAATAGVSFQTAARYLDIAAGAHVLRLVSSYHGGKRAEVTGARKVFFLDNGLRNALFGGYEVSSNRGDRGALWENAVFTELLKRTALLDRIHYWRTRNGAEVDFVVKRQDTLVGIEVKAGGMVRPRVSRASRSFIAAYQPHCFAIVNGSLRSDEVIDGVPCLFRRPWELDELLAWPTGRPTDDP